LDTVSGILDALGIEHRGPLVEFFRERDRHRVTVPGIYISGPAGPSFVTDRDVGDHLFSYLAGTGMSIFHLELSGPGAPR
jgi:hypothetical protein